MDLWNFFGAITGDDVSRENRFIGVNSVPPPPPTHTQGKNGLESKRRLKYI